MFRFPVISLKDLDDEEIIKKVEPKIADGSDIDSYDLICYALIPLIVQKDMETYIVHNLLQLRGSNVSLKELAYGIEWLIVDKFIKDEETRNNLCDSLGDRMRLVEEYGNRREQEGKKLWKKLGEKNIIQKMIENGCSINKISKITGKSTTEIESILKR